MERLKIGCVVMAAGNSSRFGSNKLAACLDGRTLFCRTLEAIPAHCFEKVVVVSQYPEFSEIVKDFHFTYIHNAEPEKGVSHTIALGLSALAECDGALFCVSDQPLLQRRSIEALTQLWRMQPEKLAALGHKGIRGNPCLFPARLFPELMALTGDVGGSAVIHRHEKELLLLEVGRRELLDADTPEALAEIEQKR